MRIAVTVCLAVLVASSALAEDLFTGVFESETRENFGSSTRGEYRLEIALVSEGRYAATIYHSGKLLGKKELITCPVESEDYLNSRPAGARKCFVRRKSLESRTGSLPTPRMVSTSPP
jgi:hypothetical protein